MPETKTARANWLQFGWRAQLEGFTGGDRVVVISDNIKIEMKQIVCSIFFDTLSPNRVERFQISGFGFQSNKKT